MRSSRTQKPQNHKTQNHKTQTSPSTTTHDARTHDRRRDRALETIARARIATCGPRRNIVTFSGGCSWGLPPLGFEAAGRGHKFGVSPCGLVMYFGDVWRDLYCWHGILWWYNCMNSTMWWSFATHYSPFIAWAPGPQTQQPSAQNSEFHQGAPVHTLCQFLCQSNVIFIHITVVEALVEAPPCMLFIHVNEAV